MPPEEVEKIVGTPEFHEFLAHSSRIVERALGQDFDILETFVHESVDVDNADKGKIKSQIQFVDEKQ
jgi:hypothetical protein